MTTLTTPDLDLLHDLEWVPACQIPGCFNDHPPATHMIILLPCGCAHLACTTCAEYLNRRGNELLEDFLHDCIICHKLAVALRIEPLP